MKTGVKVLGIETGSVAGPLASHKRCAEDGLSGVKIEKDGQEEMKGEDPSHDLFTPVWPARVACVTSESSPMQPPTGSQLL